MKTFEIIYETLEGDVVRTEIQAVSEEKAKEKLKKTECDVNLIINIKQVKL